MATWSLADLPPAYQEQARAKLAALPSASLHPAHGEPAPANQSAPRTGQRAKRRDREAEEQVLLLDLVEQRWPLIRQLLIHIPNGGSRKNRFEGWRLRRQGQRNGVSDLLLPVARGGFHGLWIEFKAAPPHDAAVTQEQREWIEAMHAEGYAACVARGVDEALAVLQQYLAGAPGAPAVDRAAAGSLGVRDPALDSQRAGPAPDIEQIAVEAS